LNDFITLPNSKQEIGRDELLSIEAIGAIEPLELDKWGFLLYIKAEDALLQRYIVNDTRDKARSDLSFIMSHHPKL